MSQGSHDLMWGGQAQEEGAWRTGWNRRRRKATTMSPPRGWAGWPRFGELEQDVRVAWHRQARPVDERAPAGEDLAGQLVSDLADAGWLAHRLHLFAAGQVEPVLEP